MNKDKTIQFRVTEEQYNQLSQEADIAGLKVNELAYRRVFSCNNNTVLPPNIGITLQGMYDMLESGSEIWNKKTQQNYKEGLETLYVYLKNNKW